MHMIRKAIFCFVPLVIGGCNFAPTQPDSVEAQTTAKQSHQLVLDTHLPETIEKSSSAINVDEELENQVAKPHEYSDVWVLLKDGLEFDLHTDRRSVKQKMAWFARNQEYIDRVADRAAPYLFHIITKLKERNMPLDLALLPIVESAYHPFAYSPSRASGIWQFIPATGRRFGLKQNWWYDGRRDITAATDAALDYLEALHKQFNGNWFHALAAYNSGEGNVARSIRKNKKKGKSTDFWSLRLPRETRNYVPSLLAIAEILKNSDKHKVNFKAIANKPYFEKVDVGSQIDLATVSKLSGLSIDEVYTLNPGYSRWATDPAGPHQLLIPVDKVADFKQKIAALPKSERIKWQQHVIRKGETLGQIASRYQTSVSALKQINRLKRSMIREGRSLLIPTAKESKKYYSLSADARKYKGLKTTGDGKRYIYSVKRGDNLWDIGRHYGISVSQLTRWNGISKRSILKLGQKLTVWVKDDENKKETNIIKTAAKSTAINGNAYTVQHGDSLWLIARKFDIHVKDLLKWNNIKKGKHLQPGQNLIVQQTTTGA
ncbi:MAG TPA: LysM peptidoglycan-binding domain-containing protein [Thiotrichaceae bacterium]|nr:LysM peptidoglycan-binding domain-containing protein [Thiotrichaceae bacterium]HIM08753.1 LysM peptidoglycan-binding domain-containing protein [Gammaproteobacteria bacterium]